MFVITLLITLLAFLVINQNRRSKKFPPGPRALPLIGNIHQLIYHVWKNEGVVPAFNYFRKTYGDVFTLWLGPLPHVSITDYETSQEVFVKNGHAFKDRFLAPIFEYVGKGYGLIFANGESWAEMRRFTLLTFRNMGVGRNIMEERILTELDARCAELDAESVDGKTIVHTSEFFNLTVGSVINSFLTGKRFDDSNKDEFLKLKKLTLESEEVFTIFDLTVPVWFLKTFFPKRFEKSVDMQNKVLDFVSRDSEKRLKDVKSGEYIIDPENPQDFLDAYFAKMRKEEKNGGKTFYTMECLRQVLFDLWIAGTDTTATTLTSGFNQLVNNPEVLKKVREELITVTNGGSRTLSLKDRSDTHYLNATLAEIQRHASILNVNFWRMTHEPTTVKGFPVEAGALITSQLSALHVNDNIFPNPEKFIPERFLANEALLNQVIPFGIGKRSCVGENIAKSELYLMLGNLILRYDIKPHGALPPTAEMFPYAAGKVVNPTPKLEFIKL